MKDAGLFAMQTERFILFYIEEEHLNIAQSVETHAYRKALATERLSTLINDEVKISNLNNFFYYAYLTLLPYLFHISSIIVFSYVISLFS